MELLNPEELEDKYIDLLINTLSEAEYKAELERLKHIPGAHPKPERTKQAQKFVDFVASNCYAGNTASDIFYDKYNYWPFNLSKSEIVKIFGSLDNAKHLFSECTNEASKLIYNSFKKHANILNSILNANE